MTRTIVSTIAGRVDAVGLRRASRMSPESLQAHDLILRARRHNYSFTISDNAEAKRLLARAIELDPANARAHATLANCYSLEWASNWVTEGDTARSLRLAKAAVALDDTDCFTHWSLGFAFLSGRRYQNSKHHLEKALELNPYDVEACTMHGMFQTYIGQTDTALREYEKAEMVDPHNLEWLPWYKAFTYVTASGFEEAIDVLEPMEEPHFEMRGILAVSYAYVGRTQEARRALDSFLSAAKDEMVEYPGRSASAWVRKWNTLQPYKNDAHRELWAIGLRKAGLDP